MRHSAPTQHVSSVDLADTPAQPKPWLNHHHLNGNSRLSPPSMTAGRPRYSLVWKLVMLPRPQQRLAGVPTAAAEGSDGEAVAETAGGAAAAGGGAAEAPAAAAAATAVASTGAGAAAGSSRAAALGGSSAPGGALCLSRPEWGEPLYFGSAQRLQNLVKATAAAGGGGGVGRRK